MRASVSRNPAEFRTMRVIGLAGWSGAGKTTLIVKLIPFLRERGFTLSTLKHAHHAFDVDQPGKDSYLHREAGAQEVLVASARRFALMHELRGAEEPSLADLLRRMSPADLITRRRFQTRRACKNRGRSRGKWKALALPGRPGHRGGRHRRDGGSSRPFTACAA